MQRFFSLLFFVLLVTVPQVSLAETSARNNFRARVVQTLRDTEKGVSSSGTIQVNQKQINKYLRHDNFGGLSFSVSTKDDFSTPEAEYKVTIGNVNTSYLQRQWWKKVVARKGSSSPEVWARKVSDYGGEYIEFLALQRLKGYVFEVRMLIAGLQEGRRRILERIELFVRNADKNGVFAKQEPSAPRKKTPVIVPDEEVPAEVAEKVPVRAGSFIGTWTGSMTNSKGQTASSSSLTIKKSPRGELIGTWHSGWKFSKSILEKRTLSFKILKAANGCRDYLVTFELDDTAEEGELNYRAFDRCNKPKNYTGKAILKKN